MKISFVGLGKLGCCMALSLASKGFHVLGVDLNRELVDKLNKGKAPHFEPGLEELIEDSKDWFQATTDIRKIVDTDVTFIMVPTPSDINGGYSTEYVETAALEVGRYISAKKSYHTVIITSTVIPGSIDYKIIPILERASGRKIGNSLGVCHVPEFMAIGNVIWDFINQDYVIIGESDKRAGGIVEEVYRQLFRGSTKEVPFYHMGLRNAELSKVANNAYVAMKMSFANTIAEICENMPSGNAREVLNALGADRRIGNPYLKPGLAFGGPCYGRDSYAFMFTANKYGAQAHLAQMTDVVNLHQTERMVTAILKALSDAGTNKLAMLGITYKPDTILTEDSAALKIAEKLIKEGIQIRVYDPSFKFEMNNLPVVPGLTYEKDIIEVLRNAEVCFIATPWSEFYTIMKQDFRHMKPEKPILIDAWGIQQQLRNDPSIDYREVGVHG